LRISSISSPFLPPVAGDGLVEAILALIWSANPPVTPLGNVAVVLSIVVKSFDGTLDVIPPPTR
jgi:hypothetical protein